MFTAILFPATQAANLISLAGIIRKPMPFLCVFFIVITTHPRQLWGAFYDILVRINWQIIHQSYTGL